jgi:hypothetical protein
MWAPEIAAHSTDAPRFPGEEELPRGAGSVACSMW